MGICYVSLLCLGAGAPGNNDEWELLLTFLGPYDIGELNWSLWYRGQHRPNNVFLRIKVRIQQDTCYRGRYIVLWDRPIGKFSLIGKMKESFSEEVTTDSSSEEKGRVNQMYKRAGKSILVYIQNSGNG